jgi:hypothetical protein
MGEMNGKGPFSWRPLFAGAVMSFLVFAAIAACQADLSLFLNVFVVAPTLFALSIGSLIYAVIRRRRPRELPATLVVLWAMAVCFFLYNREHPFAIRETARWLIWSHQYKQQVLAEPVSTNGDLKHIEWDASGFAGVANDSAYLVFDPADTLEAAARNNQVAKFNGVACKVRAIRRLESHWYAVLFYTDQSWGECS